VKHYGEAEFRRLKLDMYGGCYNKRRIRGGKSWSTHAFGAAMDIWPNKNIGRDWMHFQFAKLG